jgi:peptide deformylase
MAHDHAHDADVGPDDEGALAEERERELRRQVAFAQIRQYGDPVLRMRASEVESFDEELVRTAERMLGLMHDADGIGLAATQVGIVRRMFVFSDAGTDRVLVNPVLARVADDVEVEEEGCLSLGDVRMPVGRAVEVTLEAKDATGAPVTLDLEGVAARVVQHELDHLDGTLILDRTDPESRRDAVARLRPKLLLSR